MENNLIQKRITDTDIICPLLTQGSVYELVYGTLYHSICENDEVIYNLVVTLCLNQKVKPLQRIYSKKCLTVLNEIINKMLKTVDIRSPKTGISVHFSYSLPMAMQIY